MLITRKSTITGETRTLDLPVTELELRRHAEGELAQNVWPNLPPADREFIISGSTQEDWDLMNEALIIPDEEWD